MKRAVNGLGNRLIDKRTATGKALAKWKRDLIQDLGGQSEVSTQKMAIIDLATKSKLLLDSIDVWLLTHPTLVNARKRALLPVVRERQVLADAVARYMGMLGLEKKQKALNLYDLFDSGDESEPDDITTSNNNEQGGKLNE